MEYVSTCTAGHADVLCHGRMVESRAMCSSGFYKRHERRTGIGYDLLRYYEILLCCHTFNTGILEAKSSPNSAGGYPAMGRRSRISRLDSKLYLSKSDVSTSIRPTHAFEPQISSAASLTETVPTLLLDVGARQSVFGQEVSSRVVLNKAETDLLGSKTLPTASDCPRRSPEEQC